jgi:hypothetical protein
MTTPTPPEDQHGADAAAPAITSEAVVVCGERFYNCTCDEPLMHDGPHVCGRDGGSWHKGLNGETVIVRHPDLRRVFGR